MVLCVSVSWKAKTAYLHHCHSLTVDDSTGVINCICWKNLLETEKPLPASTAPPGTSSSLNLVEQIRKLQELVRWKSRLEIGDVARVRGHLRIYRGQREIQGSAYYKVDDPVCDVQISRMLELPRLYREVYDQPFQIPQKVQRSVNML
uniref:CST complex subunit STN1 n=1 Tax=Sphenodon punctatus TaxID=8508 RepID=A0A8D0GZM4_SPHPU